MTRMDAYCTACGIQKEVVDRYIQGAEKTLEALKANEAPTPTHEKLKELMWYAMKQASTYEEEWMNGSFRIVDTNQRLFTFFKECSSTEHQVYPRISTHFKEATVGSQWGVDFEAGELPAKKATILFAQVAGDPSTLYVKLESHGCPPFWKKGFRTLKNFTLFCLHAMDYIRTRFIASKKKGIYETRKEKIPHDILKSYKEIMGMPTSFFARMWKRQYKVKNPEEGAVLGISKMIEKLQELPASERAKFEVKKLSESLHKRQTEAISRGYTGAIKGNEVLLPSWI